MNVASALELPTIAHELRLVAAPQLDALRRGCQRTLPDGERVYLGLVALLFLQGLTWPLWAATAGTALSAVTDAAGDTTPYDMIGSPESAAGTSKWHFTFRAVNDHVAWALFGDAGPAAAESTERILTHVDVAATLGTLSGEGRVVATNLAPNLLQPLLGRRIAGEERLGWPCCECASVLPLVAVVEAAIPTLQGVLNAVAKRTADWYRGLPTDDQRPPSGRVISTAYASLAELFWSEIIADQVGAPPAHRSRFGGFLTPRKPVPAPGILLLHGDHWQLWRAVRAVTGTAPTVWSTPCGFTHPQGASDQRCR